MSSLPSELIRAYAETEYRVSGDPRFVLRIDLPSPELLALHARLRVASSAFVTACNPHGQQLPAAGNAARQAELLRAIGQFGLVALPGIGQHPRGDWPGEDSWLIVGLAQADAEALGTRFGQNAIVWAGADAIPRLVLLR
jgi:hypothetical protein